MDAPARFQSFDLLATLVAVVQHDAGVIFANSALEASVVRCMEQALREVMLVHDGVGNAHSNVDVVGDTCIAQRTTPSPQYL